MAGAAPELRGGAAIRCRTQPSTLPTARGASTKLPEGYRKIRRAALLGAQEARRAGKWNGRAVSRRRDAARPSSRACPKPSADVNAAEEGAAEGQETLHDAQRHSVEDLD